MRCEDWQEMILEREQLEPGKHRQLAEHLSICASCRVWEKALTEIEATLAAQLRAELNPSLLGTRISRAVARERRWVNGVPELLDALGWSALGIMAIAGMLLWTNWRGWIISHLLWVGAGTLAASLAWAGRVLWRDQSETRRLL